MSIDTWQTYSLVSVVLLSASVILQRLLIHKGKVNPFSYAVVFQILVGLVMLVPTFIYGFDLTGFWPVLLPATISIAAFGLGHIMYALTLQKIEASVFSVFFATSAFWIMLFGLVLLHEQIYYLQTIGIILISTSIFIPYWRKFKGVSGHGLVYGLTTGLLFGIAVYTWSIVGRETDTLTWCALSFIAAGLAAYCIKPTKPSELMSILRKKHLSRMLLLALIYGLGSLAMLIAYKEGPVILVSSLRQTGIIVTTAFALLFISSERTNLASKLIAAGISFAGVVCILLA